MSIYAALSRSYSCVAENEQLSCDPDTHGTGRGSRGWPTAAGRAPPAAASPSPAPPPPRSAAGSPTPAGTRDSAPLGGSKGNRGRGVRYTHAAASRHINIMSQFEATKSKSAKFGIYFEHIAVDLHVMTYRP